MNSLERKIGWITIHHLPLYIVATQGIVYIWGLMNPGQLHLLMLDRDAVFLGHEYWRLLSFLFITPIQNPLFEFFFLYLIYTYGAALEEAWGSFLFTLFYLTGALGSVVAALFLGSAGGAFFLNTTIFLAFAALYPNFELLLFFIIPIKIKWLAVLTWLWVGYMFVIFPVSAKVSILVSLVNYFLFFGKAHVDQITALIRRERFKRQYKE